MRRFRGEAPEEQPNADADPSAPLLSALMSQKAPPGKLCRMPKTPPLLSALNAAMPELARAWVGSSAKPRPNGGERERGGEKADSAGGGDRPNEEREGRNAALSALSSAVGSDRGGRKGEGEMGH